MRASRRFADLLVIVLGLAAETHPEEMQRALASVFDLSEVGKQSRRAQASAQAAAALAGRLTAQVTELIAAVGVDVDRIEARVDALRNHVERLERRQESQK